MNCPLCNTSLRIASSKFVSELNTTDVYNEMLMVCVNGECQNYAGSDLAHPKMVVETVRNKVN